MDNNQFPAENIAEEKPTKEEILKNKYLERSFEKIISMLKTLNKTSPKDYVIILLLVILIVLNLFGPSSDTSWKASDDNMEKQIKQIAVKVGDLEKALLTPDESSGVGTVDLNPSDSQNTPTTRKTPAKKAISGDIKSYTIQNGDTLSVIILKCYNSKDPDVIDALAHYNELKPPYFDIYPGTSLKIPPLKELMEWHKSKKES